MRLLYIHIVLLLLSTAGVLSGQHLSAKEIIQKADEKVRGDHSQAQLKMTIVRPDWSREIQLKSWSVGEKYSLILVTAPARDKGTAFLKREREMWNWQPRINRSIKMPPSMMSQSWMGSDFTNDDLSRASSTVHDYTQSIKGEEEVGGRICWVIDLVPREGVAVVWGKIKMWIDQEEFIQVKTEFYDEDDYLVNTMRGKEISNLGGRMLPKILEVTPAEEQGHKTIIEYITLDFNTPIKEKFFSIQNMKRVR